MFKQMRCFFHTVLKILFSYLLLRFSMIKSYRIKSMAQPKEGKEMNPKIKNESTDFLFKAILNLQTVEECYAFFDDLCTVPEIRAMAQRFSVAKMLNDGEIYNEIVSETGASTATISRVKRALEYGSDGYTLIFERMNDKGGKDGEKP